MVANVYDYGRTGKWIIRKEFKGKEYYYGIFNTKKEAIKYKYFLIRNFWNLKYAQNRKYDTKYRYIYRTKYGTFKIQKNNKSYGYFHDIRNALNERDLLIKCNWDLDLICCI
ncbi:hypothetical protein [Methanobrevibacter sp. DSM 116169]|uniref:hypothetical protein n=1 Tax=Methanobrevibacter sp. DSM 116169 TaxID=3242727 RepID=UPI0038FC5A45